MATGKQKDKFIFNQRLKFSWSHIIAFIGLIAAAYIVFMGFTYMTRGNFMLAGIGTAVIVILLAVAFIGAQQLKATDIHFNRKIKWERVMLILTVPVMALTMWPVIHFWAVRANDSVVVSKFTEAIGTSRRMFSDYETYSNDRIKDYGATLDSIIANPAANSAAYAAAGFKAGDEEYQRDNMLTMLRLKLISANYRDTRDKALQWITDASQGASTWNIFLIGNTDQIKEAVAAWHDTLDGLSQGSMATEGDTESFDTHDTALAETIANIDEVSLIYSQARGGLLQAIIFGLVLYAFLIFPYLLQSRNNKSMVTLFGRRTTLSGAPSDADSADIPDSLDDAADTEADAAKNASKRRKSAQQPAQDDEYQIF